MMLFLSGDRDTMADRKQLGGVVKKLGPEAHLHWLETADHGYRILKRTRKNPESVFDEIGHTAHAFIEDVIG